jgi:hypothetical protein
MTTNASTCSEPAMSSTGVKLESWSRNPDCQQQG